MHGSRVVVVEHPGHQTGAEADAAVTSTPGCVLAVRSADCAPVVLAGERTVGVVHAGWRGLLAGVLQAAAAAMRELGDGPAVATLGPCIRPGCYEFDGPDLLGLAERFGDEVRSRTTWGTVSFDLPAAVRSACLDADIEVLHDTAPCTACDRRWFSHRAHRDTGRFATLAWIDETRVGRV